MSKRRAWLIGYDIASPRRLRRVHRFLISRAFQVQYSVFAAALTAAEFDALWSGLARLIDPRRDDVRAWPLPERLDMLRIGRALPEGVLLSVTRSRALQGLLSAPPDEADVG
jgi:CRISPR-associated protein Cas2